jgi:hypothetical protein
MRTELSQKCYPEMLCLSNSKKNFEQLGSMLSVSGKTIANKLPSIKSLKMALGDACQHFFAKSKELFLILDLTNILKPFAQKIQGSEVCYISSSKTFANAYKLSVSVLTDGYTTIPLSGEFVFSNNIQDTFTREPKTHIDIAKEAIQDALKKFPNKIIKVVLDGAYATQNLFRYCLSNCVFLEVRMHANRVVEYNGKLISLKKLLESGTLKISKKKKFRTIKVHWKGLLIYITAIKRIDKHGNETHVFTASTYQAEPRQHAKNYRTRWLIEQFFRTAKQSLGLNDCQSTSLDKQYKHVLSVLLAYAKAQLYKLKQKLKTPEDALRRLREKFNKYRNSQNHYPVESLENFMC